MEIEYGTKHKLKVKTIYNAERSFPAAKYPGQFMKAHRVVFTNGYEGEFFQLSTALTYNNQSLVKINDDVCFIPKQPNDPKQNDKLEMCDDMSGSNKDTQSAEGAPQRIVSVSGTAIVFATGMVKDVVIAYMEKKGGGTLDDYMEEIKTRSIDLKNHILNNT